MITAGTDVVAAAGVATALPAKACSSREISPPLTANDQRPEPWVTRVRWEPWRQHFPRGAILAVGVFPPETEDGRKAVPHSAVAQHFSRGLTLAMGTSPP